MEGVTDPVFRDLVLERHRPDQLGGAFTEFVRVVDRPLPRAVIARHLGPRRHTLPVGLQLMGADPAAVAASAARAVEAGAPLVDLNFGCPAKGALRGCAGAALLREPASLEALVDATVRAVAGAAPVSAKIRAGWDDATHLEDVARAVEAGGAALLTVHCRTRREGYQDPVDWSRLARAVAAVRIPVCGNGGVREHADLERMREATGVALVMVGRAALADPWIFSGRRVGRAEAAGFLAAYADAMTAHGAHPGAVAARTKQLLRTWTAGGLLRDEAQRAAWLAERDPERLLTRIRARKVASAAVSDVTGDL